jgi:ribosomal protein S18 acetylase RimI-like enzyme
MTARLRPITEREYALWYEQAIAAYAEEKVRAGNWLAADAPDLARRDFERLLPYGLLTPGHYIYAVVGDEGTYVGAAWFGPGPADFAYLYDIVIDAPYRRRGYGRAAMLALEEYVISLGLRGIALHVFGHNTAARALYESLGYTITNINMAKRLAD